MKKKKSFSVFEFVYRCEDAVQRALVLYPGKGPSPAVLYLHGRRGSVWESLERARMLQKNGYVVYVAPLLGLGRSPGVSDMNGPHTRAVLAPVVEALFRDTRVDANQVAVWGLGRGAHLAAGLVTDDHRFRAAVLESGVYDLEQMCQHVGTSERVKKVIQKECGTEPKALQDRSPIRLVHSIYCPVFVISKAQDSEAYKAQARGYESALTDAAVPHDVCMLEEEESTNTQTRGDHVVSFLDQRFHRTQETTDSSRSPEQQ